MSWGTFVQNFVEKNLIWSTTPVRPYTQAGRDLPTVQPLSSHFYWITGRPRFSDWLIFIHCAAWLHVHCFLSQGFTEQGYLGENSDWHKDRGLVLATDDENSTLNIFFWSPLLTVLFNLQPFPFSLSVNRQKRAFLVTVAAVCKFQQWKAITSSIAIAILHSLRSLHSHLPSQINSDGIAPHH